MEYDRALYRVYERVMEEITSSAAPEDHADADGSPLLPFFVPSWVSSRVRFRAAPSPSVPSIAVEDDQSSHDSRSSESSQAEPFLSSRTLFRRRSNRNPLLSHHADRMRTRMSESRRAARRRDSDEESSEEEDSLPPSDSSEEGRREGGTRAGLRTLLRVCSLVGCLHLWILWCLHSTYVRQGGCLEYALGTRPEEERDTFLIRRKEEDKEKGERMIYFGDDEILQIKIVYGNKCRKNEQCSRVHRINETEDGSALWSGENPHWNSEAFWETVQYRFTTNEAMLYLDDGLVRKHNASLVNITLTENCLSGGTDSAKFSLTVAMAQLLAKIYGMDAALINNLMYGLFDTHGKHRDGFFHSISTNERWNWRKEMLEPITNFSTWFQNKLGTLFLSFLSFYLITSITALIVRVLTSSGVVLMFPIFSIFRALGMPNADDRLLSLSYPWIGRALTQITRSQIHPPSHFIWAHFFKIFLYYCMYEASEAAWSVVLYGKSIPESLPIWIYGFAMIWEYFCMVFVRSALSVYFFPKITFLYFASYHVYFYSIPYGYFDVALYPLFFFMLHAMLYTVLAFEVPAAGRGTISMECPREVYTRVAWGEWNATMPAEWTLFLPINSRSLPLYDVEIDDPANRTEDHPEADAVEEG